MPLVIFASGGGGGIALVVALAAYLAPSIVGFARHHHNQWAIFALNLLLGWTVLGWIGALVWALTRPSPRPQVVHVYHDHAPPPGGPPSDPPELR